MASRLATQFVGGRDAKAAKEKAMQLKDSGFQTSLYYLGEYVDSPELIVENVKQIMAVIGTLGQTRLELHVSIDPTQVGYSVKDQFGQNHAMRIGRLVREQPGESGKRLMLDMEDYSYVQKTLDLYYLLLQENVPAAVTIQAYLYRSEQDIRKLIEKGATVRLVKGAFVGRKDRAWTAKAALPASWSSGSPVSADGTWWISKTVTGSQTKKLVPVVDPGCIPGNQGSALGKNGHPDSGC